MLSSERTASLISPDSFASMRPVSSPSNFSTDCSQVNGREDRVPQATVRQAAGSVFWGGTCEGRRLQQEHLLESQHVGLERDATREGLDGGVSRADARLPIPETWSGAVVRSASTS
jgi:hypothetical protein